VHCDGRCFCPLLCCSPPFFLYLISFVAATSKFRYGAAIHQVVTPLPRFTRTPHHASNVAVMTHFPGIKPPLSCAKSMFSSKADEQHRFSSATTAAFNTKRPLKLQFRDIYQTPTHSFHPTPLLSTAALSVNGLHIYGSFLRQLRRSSQRHHRFSCRQCVFEHKREARERLAVCQRL
jgi:hypothetical protein